jgi:phosphate-selective porin OprO/OprP
VNAFTDRTTAGGDFKAGISSAFTGSNWTVSAGLFGDNVAIVGSGPTEEGWGINGRATFAPILEDGKILHLGASGYWRRPGGNGVVRFRDRPEIAVDSIRLVDTGNIAARSYHLLAGEVAGVWGPVTAQAEYLRVGVNRSAPGLSNVNFDGGYVALSYFLTGESRSYKDGLFGRVKPKNNFSAKDGGWGAFELAARFSTINLDDNDILGGEQDNFTLGLNWHFNPNTRLQFNWVRFDAERQGIVNKGDIFAARFAIDW